jgi:eukaryotic-like serine/threonine-protein kinase
MSRLTSTVRFGDLLDHYRIEDPVAISGMASLFRATDTRTGRPVAVKIPHRPKGAAQLILNRLRRHIELDEKFDHPGLVKMLPKEDSSHRYVVMEWVEGRLLRQIIDEETRLSIERSIHIALQICQVLEYIHARGIVHLDLKPDNIIVDMNDGIKLIDFDLAREAKRGLGVWLRPQRTGTPDYASPEQIKGKPSGVQSDLYSLGLILYEMLTGEVPFSGVTPPTALKLKLLVDPMSPREINPGVPWELEQLICRSISREPARRPPTARDFGLELEQINASSARELVSSL